MNKRVLYAFFLTATLATTQVNAFWGIGAVVSTVVSTTFSKIKNNIQNTVIGPVVKATEKPVKIVSTGAATAIVTWLLAKLTQTWLHKDEIKIEGLNKLFLVHSEPAWQKTENIAAVVCGLAAMYIRYKMLYPDNTEASIEKAKIETINALNQAKVELEKQIKELGEDVNGKMKKELEENVKKIEEQIKQISENSTRIITEDVKVFKEEMNNKILNLHTMVKEYVEEQKKQQKKTDQDISELKNNQKKLEEEVKKQTQESIKHHKETSENLNDLGKDQKNLEIKVENGFKSINTKVDETNKNLNNLSKDQSNLRTEVGNGFNSINTKVDETNKNLNNLGKDQSDLRTEVKKGFTSINTKFDDNHKELDEQLKKMGNGIVTLQDLTKSVKIPSPQKIISNPEFESITRKLTSLTDQVGSLIQNNLSTTSVVNQITQVLFFTQGKSSFGEKKLPETPVIKIFDPKLKNLFDQDQDLYSKPSSPTKRTILYNSPIKQTDILLVNSIKNNSSFNKFLS